MFSIKEIDTTVNYTPDEVYLPFTSKFEKINDIQRVVNEIKNEKLGFINNWNNIVLAGGSLSTILLNFDKNDEYNINDYDFFFYQIDKDQALNIVKNIKKNLGDNVKIVISKFAISLYTNSNKYQFITKLFACKEDIINSFDIDASCIYFDGKDIILNKRCKNAFETGYNTIDVSKYTSTYSRRLLKYYNEKGFGIIFTGFGTTTFNFINIDKIIINIKIDDDLRKIISIVAFNRVKDYLLKNYDVKEYYLDEYYDYNNSHKYYSCFFNRLLDDKFLLIITEDINHHFTLHNDIINNILNDTYYPLYRKKDLKNVLDKINKGFDMEWDDHRNGLDLTEIYNNNMTLSKFYGLK